MKYCLSPRDFPRAQAIFHRFALLSSQLSYSVMYTKSNCTKYIVPAIMPAQCQEQGKVASCCHLLRLSLQFITVQQQQLRAHFEISPSFESRAVIEILSLLEITKKSLTPHIINSHVKSFPTMYDTQGQRNALVDNFEQYC